MISKHSAIFFSPSLETAANASFSHWRDRFGVASRNAPRNGAWHERPRIRADHRKFQDGSWRLWRVRALARMSRCSSCLNDRHWVPFVKLCSFRYSSGSSLDQLVSPSMPLPGDVETIKLLQFGFVLIQFGPELSQGKTHGSR
jgi:hypothetical protein